VSPAQQLVADAAVALVALTLMGMLVRNRAALCWPFAGYLAVSGVTNRLVTWWPQLFWTYGFWTFKEMLLAVLACAIAVQLSWSVLAHLARPRRVTTLAVMGISIGAGLLGRLGLRGVLGDSGLPVLGLLNAAGVWGLVVVVVAAYWYGIPFNRWHRQVVLGLLLYKGAYGVVLEFLPRWYALAAGIDPAAYVATLLIWLVAAWQPGAGEDVRERLDEGWRSC
jgi:hypothetical protein